MLTKEDKNKISKTLNGNKQVVYILSLEEMDHVILNLIWTPMLKTQ
ncbi:MAG: hypothetical protein QM484_00130 [Woeseiaceae bacterium]